MMDLMFEMPSRSDVVGCTIPKEMVRDNGAPLLTYRGEREKKKKEA